MFTQRLRSGANGKSDRLSTRETSEQQRARDDSCSPQVSTRVKTRALSQRPNVADRLYRWECPLFLHPSL